VRRDIIIHHALVVVDEQTRGREVWQPLLQEKEFHRTGPTVTGAGTQLTLVIDGRALRTQVHHRWESCGFNPGAEQRISYRRQGGLPPIPFVEFRMYAERLGH